eukprot:jgi/Mesen1/6053/ME000308S05244
MRMAAARAEEEEASTAAERVGDRMLLVGAREEAREKARREAMVAMEGLRFPSLSHKGSYKGFHRGLLAKICRTSPLQRGRMCILHK